MDNIKEAKKEIEAVGLKVKVLTNGLAVYRDKEKNEDVIYTTQLDKLIAIAQKYNLKHYISFLGGFVRLH